MEDAPAVLFLFEDKTGHRIYRKSRNNHAPCSRCGSPFSLIAEVPRNEGETDVQHNIRTLAWKKPRVN